MDIDDERAIFEKKVLLPPAKKLHEIIERLGGRECVRKLGKDTHVLVPSGALLEVDNYYKKAIIYNRRLAYKKRDGTLRSLRQLGLLFGYVCRYIYERDKNVSSVETVVKNKETGLDEIVEVAIPYTDDLKEKIAEYLKIKCGYVARYYIARNENGVEREIAVIKPNSLSFRKASQKEVNDFFTNLNNFLVAAYGHSLEDIKKEYEGRRIPPKYALRQEKMDDYQKRHVERWQQQGGLCFGALEKGTAYEVLENPPTELHHVVHNTKSNRKKHGKKELDKKTVLMSKKFHAENPQFEGDFEKKT